MKSLNITFRHRLVIGLMIVATAPQQLQAEIEYNVIDLGTLGGGASFAYGINDRSQVVGSSYDADGRLQAFVWQNGLMNGLGFLPDGTQSVARAINNHGEITGYARLSNTFFRAFRYTGDELENLGTLGGRRSWGYAINNHGLIAGSSEFTNARPNLSDHNSFTWLSNQFVRVRPYHNWLACSGSGVNDHGMVCGTTFLWASSERWWAYIWRDNNTNGLHDTGEMIVLGSLGSTNWQDYTTSGATAINNAGQVVGYTSITNASFPQHAFLVTPSNGVWKIPNDDLPPGNELMISLGTLDGLTNNSYANAINDKSWIVGTSTTRYGTNQAFLWRNGVMTNLNDLIVQNSGWVLTNATGINENNEIVGSGLYQGQPRAFLLVQDGRITTFDWIMRTDHTEIFTNQFGTVFTQSVERVESQLIRWSGLWGDELADQAFTLEYADSIHNGIWKPFDPTSQWPFAGNEWTVSYGIATVPFRFFRIRAEPSQP
ncbi:MAG TPA: DUF3466 family protein [Kiritimatiellia bacterium]|nr:DUF3466 family protein [Kiritimatiellia bacterium]